jgi:hypothetical protein
MSIKLTDTRIIVLSAAAQRDDRCLVAPRNLKGGAAQKVAAKLIDGGLAKEIEAKPGAPVWRQDEQAGLSFALTLMAAGVRAIPIDSSASDAMREDTGGHVEVVPLLRKSFTRLLPKFRRREARARLRPEAARSWHGSSSCFSAIVAPQR